MSALSQSKEYVSFRRSVPLQQKMVEGAQAKGAKAWRLYDFGPKQVRCPIVFLPTAGGTAESYFKQLMGLGSLGYRVVAVDYPPYWTHIEWCDGFTKLLDQLGFEKVHLFGTALGGFLAQVYAQQRTKRIESLILCNTFINTDAFRQNAPYMGLFSWVPDFALKRIILSNFPSGALEKRVADSVDFMVEQIETLSQPAIASRLTLNSAEARLEPGYFPDSRVMIIETYDEVALHESLRSQVRKFYPESRYAQLKSGGNFPFLARPEDVNMHIRIHCRQFEGTRTSPLHVPDGPAAPPPSSSTVPAPATTPAPES